jgi:hypothetical protein
MHFINKNDWQTRGDINGVLRLRIPPAGVETPISDGAPTAHRVVSDGAITPKPHRVGYFETQRCMAEYITLPVRNTCQRFDQTCLPNPCGGVSYSGTGMIQKAQGGDSGRGVNHDCGSCGTTVSGSLSDSGDTGPYHGPFLFSMNSTQTDLVQESGPSP